MDSCYDVGIKVYNLKSKMVFGWTRSTIDKNKGYRFQAKDLVYVWTRATMDTIRYTILRRNI